MRLNDVPQALGGLQLTLCACPHINLLMLDDQGKPLAAFIASPDQAEKIANDLQAMVREARALTGDAIGQCEGQA